jgi:filamentous hemagglutinin
MKGEGNTDETLRQSALVAKGKLTIHAVDGLKIDVRKLNEQTVSQAVDAMVATDPELGWLKEAEARGDIDWHRVEEIHKSFKYEHSGLGAGAQLILAILLAAVTGGAGAALVGAAEGTIYATAANLAFVSLETTAANSAISNKGKLSAVAKDTFSKESLRNAAIAGATGAFTQGVIDPYLGGKTVPFNNLTKGFDLNTVGGIGGLAIHAGAQGLAAGAIKTAIGGGSLGQNLQQSLVAQAGNVVAATAFNFVGGYAQSHWQEAKEAGDSVGMAMWKEGGIARTAMHALFGGAVSSATGGDFKTGAVAAGANQAMAGVLNSTFENKPELRQAFSQIVGLTAAGLAGGGCQ